VRVGQAPDGLAIVSSVAHSDPNLVTPKSRHYILLLGHWHWLWVDESRLTLAIASGISGKD
jgi:hypothetical protein